MSLFFASPAPGETLEFDKLQSSYKDAVSKATKPLTQTYLKELERLRDSYTRGANLDGASKVQTEIDTVNHALAYADIARKAPTAPAVPVPATPLSAKDAAAANKQPELRWFVGKTWLTDAQTKWTFEKDGTGDKVRGTQKVAVFKWRVLESGALELTEQSAPGKPANITYLRFKDKNEAWFGSSIDQLNARLHFP